jgi:DNA invertase Pin-like site-specific DNA recombinase
VAVRTQQRAGSFVSAIELLLFYLQDLVVFVGELHGKGVDLYLHQQGIDTSTPAGKAMFQMMGSSPSSSVP